MFLLFLHETLNILGYLFRSVDEELAVVHTREDLDVRLRAERQQMFDLRLGNEGFLRAVPEMDVSTIDGVQTVGIDRFVTVHYGLRAAEGPYLFALV